MRSTSFQPTPAANSHKFRIAVASAYLFAWCALVFAPTAASQTPTPSAMPSITISPASPIAHQPFEVIATFTREYCLSDRAPLFAYATVQNGLFSVALSHINAGTCSTQKRFKVPGLPSSVSRIRLSVTQSVPVTQSKDTYDAEVGEIYVTVRQPEGYSAFPLIMAANFNGPTFNDGPISLVSTLLGDLFGKWGQTPLAPTSRQGTSIWLYGKNPYSNVIGVPDTFAPLYALPYPRPLVGTYWTSSLTSCQSLASDWGQSATTACVPAAYGLKMQNGVCPMGAAPAYRLFDPVAVSHRYTMSTDEYLMLLQSQAGYLGEGIAWCALAAE